MFPKEKGKIMAELEAVIEKRLIDQLCSGESQWTYRPDIRTEEQLWNNFKYILEQNNKAKLNDTPLSDSEFAKVKNDLSHASFYDAGKWLVGENGKVYVHVQRGNETLHLLVMNNEHIAGGTSVYEVINQYQAFATGEENDNRDRRFDVTLLINGIPMIHIELKNKEHSYMDAYRQIKKYIAEGKFHGMFSNVQMFVVSNAVDTKYFSAARDTELNKKFITGWIDKENLPVCDYIDFAEAVLKIPEAHEMVTKYTVLDNDKKKLLILRPYQIHAIEAMRAASRRGESGFIWHTTGSGKTMTSYKATRNLLMDIPSIEKTIFLIDRKDLDLQTKMAFQSYADNDTIDVDDTDYVDTLIKKLTDGNRQMIVTTRQKMQTMVNTLNDIRTSDKKITGTQGIGVLMANSLMFQRFPNHNGYDDPQFSSFYGQTLPLLKRGIPVELVHMENTPFKETFKGLHILVMSYSNMKPMKPEYHNYLADWVKKGGILIYCGEDIDPYQTVLEWWNTEGNEYKAPSEHLFEKMNLSRNPGEGTYRYGKGTVIVMREDPKHFVLKAGNDQKYFETIASAYQKKQGIEIETKNSFIVERGPYTIAAVMDESVSKEPLTLSGLYIDLFDKDLPVLTSKQIQPGEQGYLYDLNKVSGKIKAKVLCGASRIYDEKVSKQSYSFVAKSPINTTNVSRVLLPRKPEKIRVNGKEEQPEWDESSKTLLLSFENDPAGVNVSIEW